MRRRVHDVFTRIWGCSSAGRAPALQAGGQRFDPAQLHHSIGVELTDIILGEKIGLHRLHRETDACSAYIVKRRYVWKLPGVDGDRKVA